MMFEVKFNHVQIVVALHAFVHLIQKWFTGVLIGKIIHVAIVKANPDGDADQTGGSDLYRVVLMQGVSFETVAIAGFIWVSLNTLLMPAEKTLAALRAAHTGRRLRSEVLRRALGNHGGAGAVSDIDHKASELVSKIYIVESFQANEEAKILYDKIRISLAAVLVFIFLWYVGLLLVASMFLGNLIGALVEKRRTKYREAMENNSDDVNARLMDTIKNAVMVRMADMSREEVSALLAQEAQTDEHRLADARLRFLSELAKRIFINYFQIFVPVIVWFDIADTAAESALQLVTALLISFLLMEEGAKSIESLVAISDKKLAAESAQSDLDEFLGLNEAENKDGFSNEDETSGKDPAEDCDEEMPGTADAVPPQPLTRTSMLDGKSVDFLEVTLSYPGRSRPVLHNFTRSFARGKVHGLIGESGAGKSTTMKVVADLLAPNAGTVTHWSGMKIAYVSQDQNLFARTIRENITYGAKDAVGDGEVWAALYAANIDTFIKSLPNGLDEALVEGEKMVSGGQLQRLHLAHLFCTWKSADLVLLDECLSALDEKSRDLLITRLESFLEGKTALVITHHSEMLRLCTEIHDLTPETETLLKPTHFRPTDARHLRTSIFESSVVIR